MAQNPGNGTFTGRETRRQAASAAADHDRRPCAGLARVRLARVRLARVRLA